MSWKCYQCDHINKANELECDVCGATRNLYAEEVFELKETINKQNKQLATTEDSLIRANANLDKKQKAFEDLDRSYLEVKNQYELQNKKYIELRDTVNDLNEEKSSLIFKLSESNSSVLEKHNQINLLQNEINKIKTGDDKNNVWTVLFVITTVVSIIAGVFMYNNSQNSKDDLQNYINNLQKSNTDYQISIMKLQQTNTDLQSEVNKLNAKGSPQLIQSSSRRVLDFSANISSFLATEESRDFNLIYTFISPKISRYYDLDNPTYSQLKNRYEYLWSITRNSKNTIQSITKINEYTYDMQTEFEYYNIKKKKVITVNSTVRFLFDGDGKIIETYGINK